MPRARSKRDSDSKCYLVWDIISECDLVWDIVRDRFSSLHTFFDSLGIRHDDFVFDIHSFIFRNTNADNYAIKWDKRCTSGRRVC